MKNLKRTIAVFVSAVMVMVMLAGCGGGGSSLGKQLQDQTGASASSDLDKVANALAKADLTDSIVEDAVAEYGDIYKIENVDYSSVMKVPDMTFSIVATTNVSEGSARADIFEILQYENMTTEEVLEYFSEYKVEEESDTEKMYISAVSTGAKSGIVVMDFAFTGDNYDDISSGFESAYSIMVLALIYAGQYSAG